MNYFVFNKFVNYFEKFRDGGGERKGVIQARLWDKI